ncbi:hypothetical protein ACFX2H_022914 [Malus domestica]
MCTPFSLYLVEQCLPPPKIRRPRLNMHGVVFCEKSKRLRTSQWRVKLQRCSLILRIAFLRKNGDGVVLKTFEKYHDRKKKKNQPQNLSSTTKRAATEQSFRAHYSGKGNQNVTQSHYVSSFLHRMSTSPPRKNYDQKALSSEAPLQACTAPHDSAPPRENCD